MLWRKVCVVSILPLLFQSSLKGRVQHIYVQSHLEHKYQTGFKTGARWQLSNEVEVNPSMYYYVHQSLATGMQQQQHILAPTPLHNHYPSELCSMWG